MRRAKEVFEAQRKYERRDGYNRGVRAVVRYLGITLSDRAAATILRDCLKPKVANPGMRVKA
jgi:hypothetical protein